MNDPTAIMIFLGLCSSLTAVISAVVGMAGGIVLLSIMTFFLPYQIIIPVHGIVQLVSNATRVYFLRKNVIKPVAGWFALGLPFGAFLSVYVLKQISHPEYFQILIAILIFYAVFKPKRMPHLKIPIWSFCFIGASVGFLGPLVGATGPFIAPFFLRDDFTKENIIATKASVQILGHLIKIPAFLYLGFDFSTVAPMIIVLSIGAIIGTKFGVQLLQHINQRAFMIIFKTALFFAGCRLTYKFLEAVSGDKLNMLFKSVIDVAK